MKKTIIFFGLFILTIPAFADLDVNGYFEYRYNTFDLEKTETLTSSKLRLDFDIDTNSRKVTMNGDFIIQNYDGLTEFDLRNFTPEYVQAVLPWYAAFVPLTMKLENRTYLDNAYISFYSKHFNLRLGKQQLNWGVGYFWRPTDLFNPRDIIEPEYEKEGINAIKAELAFSGFWKLQFTYLPEQDYESSKKAVRLKGQALNMDLEMFMVDTWKESFRDLFEFEKQFKMYGATLNGEILTLGTWVEYGFHSIDGFEEGYSRWTAGLDYTFKFQTYIMAEYYRNDKAVVPETKQYPVWAWLDYLAGYSTGLAMEYAALYISHPITDLSEFSISGITNLNDKSNLITFTFNYNYRQNLDLEIILYQGVGDYETEFETIPTTGLAQLKFYF